MKITKNPPPPPVEHTYNVEMSASDLAMLYVLTSGTSREAIQKMLMGRCGGDQASRLYRVFDRKPIWTALSRFWVAADHIIEEVLDDALNNNNNNNNEGDSK